MSGALTDLDCCLIAVIVILPCYLYRKYSRYVCEEKDIHSGHTRKLIFNLSTVYILTILIY